MTLPELCIRRPVFATVLSLVVVLVGLVSFQRLAVRHVSPIITPADLARVPVEATGDAPTATGADGTPLHLGDVADMVRDHPLLAGDAIVGDRPGLLLVVEKFPWGNALDVNQGVEAALDQLRPATSGIDFDTTIFRPATFIDDAINVYIETRQSPFQYAKEVKDLFLPVEFNTSHDFWQTAWIDK